MIDILEYRSKETGRTRSKVNGKRASVDGGGQSSTVDEVEETSPFGDVISGEESNDTDE